MPQATYSVTIARPVYEVFDYLADGERCREWRPGVTDIERVSGEGLGARYRQGVAGPGGRRIAADYEITAFDRPNRLEFQTVAGPVRPHGRYDIRPDQGGTSVVFSLDARLSGLRSLFMGPMVQRTMASEVKALERGKARLEDRIK